MLPRSCESLQNGTRRSERPQTHVRFHSASGRAGLFSRLSRLTWCCSRQSTSLASRGRLLAAEHEVVGQTRNLLMARKTRLVRDDTPVFFQRLQVALGVRDVGRSVAFYRRHLAFEVLSTMGDDCALLGRDNVTVALVLASTPAVASFAGCYLYVSDVE